MGVFETEYKDDMTEEEAIDLCVRGIEAGVYNDLGSGSNVDYVVINKEGAKMTRGFKADNKKLFDNPNGYNFPIGTTDVLDTEKIPLVIEEGQAPMEL